MSKKQFTAFVSGLTDEQMMQMTGVGATMREFGKALEEEWVKRNGVLLTADERKENGGKPNRVSDPVIDIEVPGVMCLMLRPCEDNNKTRGHGYANDVGLADKVKFGNVPPTLLTEILVDKVATMLNGNIADKVLTELRDALRACMTIEDGKFSFDKKKAPPLSHPVEVAEWLTSLKTEFVGTTSGATHVSMEVIPVPADYDSSAASDGVTDTPSEGIPSPVEAVPMHHDNDLTTNDNNPEEESPVGAEAGISFIDQQAEVLL